MVALDWVIVAVFLFMVVAGGLLFSRKASGSLDNYFLSGRSLPWWLAGTSILATSFASDTPLHTTSVIRDGGLAAAWFYWSGILTQLVVTFGFSRMWRRAGTVTDVEFIELRYAGQGAAILRGTMAVVRGLFLEALTLAWVTLGMVKVIGVLLELPPTIDLPVAGPMDSSLLVVLVLMVLVCVYSVGAGMWGVVITDFIEFIVALVGAIVLAVIAFVSVGGSSGLKTELAAQGRSSHLDFFPDLTTGDMTLLALAVYMGVQWWASDAVDGSGKRAQRFLACRSERDALASGVWNLAVQWVIRSWPWYVVALASLVLYPDVVDGEKVYPMMMRDLLPIGLKGLMVAAFLAAFMSTVDTHLNLCSAYLVNDVYRRFLRPGRPDAHYVGMSRFTVVFVAVIASLVALSLPSVFFALKLKIELIGGIGSVLVVRWFWWRVNAWCELAALLSSISLALGLHFLSPLDGSDDFPIRLLIIAFGSMAVWIVVALFSKPEPREHLEKFYQQVRPPRLGWGTISHVAPEIRGDTFWLPMLGCGIFVCCAMFGLGKLILGEPGLGITLMAIAAVSLGLLLRWLRAEPLDHEKTEVAAEDSP